MLKRALWIACGLGLVVLVALLARPRPVRVDVAPVRRGDIRSYVEEEGKTRVVDRYLVAAPVGGRMLRLALRVGDRVEAGQVFARIDPIVLRGNLERSEAQIRALKERIAGAETLPPKPEEIRDAEVRERQADLARKRALFEVEQAEAAYTRARKEAERARELRRAASSTAAEVDRAEADEIQTRARLEAAKLQSRMSELGVESARLASKVLQTKRTDFEWKKRDYAQQIAAIESMLPALRDDVKRTDIVAPAAGVVLNLVEESERVQAPGALLVEIGDLDSMEVEAEFLSEDAAHMTPGMTAEIFGRALGPDVVRSRIKRIYPSAFKKISSLGVEQQRVIVVVEFDNRGFKLGDRYRVEVRVILDERKDALLVPEGALFRRPGGWSVFRVAGGRALRTPVETGLRDGRDREVLEGLAAGETVILHPGEDLDEGARIEPLPGGAADELR